MLSSIALVDKMKSLNEKLKATCVTLSPEEQELRNKMNQALEEMEINAYSLETIRARAAGSMVRGLLEPDLQSLRKEKEELAECNHLFKNSSDKVIEMLGKMILSQQANTWTPLRQVKNTKTTTEADSGNKPENKEANISKIQSLR